MKRSAGMTLEAAIRAELGDNWLPVIYQQRIRTLRTRAVHLDISERENTGEIIYTLLGIELKVNRRRFACPDLATARYLRVFARIGCRDFAIPYDITKVSAAADELETGWQRAIVLLTDRTRDLTPRSNAALRSNLVKAMRKSLKKIGPGEVMPAFDTPTKQRAS